MRAANNKTIRGEAIMTNKKLRTVLLASSILMTAAGSAYAQEAGQVEEIVVTGSRLQAAGFQAPTPVTVVSGAALTSRAPSTIAEVVNELPSFRQSATNTQNQRGNGNGGQNRVDLRGLGAERTLVLVDGRRHVPTNLTGTLDINLIPTPLVDRIEVVTGGASAAYGSDAVSGVVNFILKDRMSGIQGTVQYGVSERGDNKEPTVSLAGGKNFFNDRLHIVAGADYSDNKGVGTLYTRDWGRKQPGLVAFGTGRGTLPAQGLLENVTYSTQSDGGLINAGPLRGIAFGANGTPFNFVFGQVYSNLMFGGPNNSPDANPFGNWKIAAPHERYTGLIKATFDISDTSSVFAEYGYAKQSSAGLSSYHQGASLVILNTNPFIPADVRAQMLARGLDRITVGRYESQLGGYKLLAKTGTNRFTAGIKGEVLDGWKWDAYIEHGQTDGNQKVRTNIFEGNYLAAIYAVTGPNGAPVCGPVATNPNLTGANAIRVAQIQPGCVPFNIFGRTSPSDAAKQYITYNSNNETRYRQDVVAANISGEPITLPAGPLSVAAGLEHRKESAYSVADPFGQQVVALSNNGSTYSGKIKVTEGYLEVGVPVLKDLAWAKALDLNGAVRRTHYSTSGNVTTWKVGATYEPTDFLRLRATRSRDIRAGNINELFQTRNIGITASFLNPINGKTGAINTISGGNPNLTPEIADTLTVGAVFQPHWGLTQGLRVSLDYYKVDISDVIASVAAADIARRCAAGLQAYCDLIVFDATAPSGISTIASTPANLNRLKTTGLDLEVAYRVPIELVNLPGKLDIRSLTTWVDDLKTIDAVSNVDRSGSGALGGVPEYTSNLSLTYGIGRFSNTLTAKYTSKIRGDATLIGPDSPGYNPTLSNSINKNQFPAMVYWNWSGQFDLKTGEQSLQLFANVNNLFNKDPATLAIIAFASGGNPYDVIGRTYKAGLRFKF